MTKKHESDKELKERISDLEDSLKRTAADFANYKKRVEAQQGDLIEFAKAEFVSKITPVLDNFRRAFEHAPDNDFAKGIKQIEKQLEDLLRAEGLEKIEAEAGQDFDHNFHEAISCEENKDVESNHIIAVLETGWKYNNRVIKPAKVRVSK